MTCPAKIHTGAPSLGDLSCRLDAGHEGPQHDATGLFEWQTITWFEGDRRQFTGHHGNHAS